MGRVLAAGGVGMGGVMEGGGEVWAIRARRECDSIYDSDHYVLGTVPGASLTAPLEVAVRQGAALPAGHGCESRPV